MERDFLGLPSKESLIIVKEEISNDGCKDSGFTKGPETQWPFSNKVSALPNLMSFKVAQNDKTKKIVSDPLVSSGFMPFSTADAFDPSQKRSTGEIQKSFHHDRQGETHFSLTASPVQHNAHAVHHDMKIPVCNQAISISLSNHFLKSHFATTTRNLSGITMKQQLLGGIPITAPHSILPTIGPVTGITDSRNNVKASGPPAQLTIFYGGTVHVYDDISPEKAQAIMFLAGNGTYVANNTTHLKAAPSSKLVGGDGGPVNQPVNAPPCFALFSPLSVSSHTGAQSGSGSTINDELMADKTTVVASTLVSKVEPPKTVNAKESIAATTMIPSACQQSRHASLARFLEKRKERVIMNAAPYNLNKKSPECSLSADKESNHDI